MLLIRRRCVRAPMLGTQIVQMTWWLCGGDRVTAFVVAQWVNMWMSNLCRLQSRSVWLLFHCLHVRQFSSYIQWMYNVQWMQDLNTIFIRHGWSLISFVKWTCLSSFLHTDAHKYMKGIHVFTSTCEQGCQEDSCVHFLPPWRSWNSSIC